MNPKKVYSIDNGLSDVNSASFSEDNGKMLENLIFINLRNKNKEIFYFQESGECDFITKKKNKIEEAIQVCYEINAGNKDREINGLLEAMKKFNIKKGLIITFNQEDKIKDKDSIITIIPVWKWLINN